MFSTPFFPVMIFQPAITTETVILALQLSVHGQHLHHHGTYMVDHGITWCRWSAWSGKKFAWWARCTSFCPKILSSHGSKCSLVRTGVTQQFLSITFPNSVNILPCQRLSAWGDAFYVFFSLSPPRSSPHRWMDRNSWGRGRPDKRCMWIVATRQDQKENNHKENWR